MTDGKRKDRNRAWSPFEADDDPMTRFEKLMKHVNIVSDEEAEQVDMVVCMPDEGPRYFMDDIITQCAMCGITIKHRPHVPKTPPKVCIHCAVFLSKEQTPSA